VPNHVCSSECPFWRHGDIFICCLNGRPHVCTDMACTRKQTTHEANICELTGIAYPVDFEVTFEQGGGDSAATFRRNVKQCFVESATPTATTITELAKQVGKGLTGGDPVLDREVAAKQISDMMPNLSRSRCNQLAEVARLTWLDACSTQVWRDSFRATEHKAYLLPAHTVAVMYAMKRGDGVRVAYPTYCKRYVDVEWDVQQQLKDIDRLPVEAVHPTIRSSFLKIITRFHTLMHAWCEEAVDRGESAFSSPSCLLPSVDQAMVAVKSDGAKRRAAQWNAF
jgi:hypothetical protein